MSINLYYNSNTSKNKKQACNLKYLEQLRKLHPLLPFDRLTKCDHAIIGYFLELSSKYFTKLYPSQSHIALTLGYNRQHINRRIRKLHEFGFITKITTFVAPNKSWTVYDLSPVILEPEIQELFPWTFKTFKAIVAAWFLISNPLTDANIQIETNTSFIKKATQVNVSYLYSTSTTTTSTSNISLVEKKTLKKEKNEAKKINIKIGDGMKATSNLNLPLSTAKELAKVRLRLTQDGLIEIHKFDDRAIMAALLELPDVKTFKTEKLFYDFCAKAHAWHKANNVLRDYDQITFLRETFPLVANAKMTFDAQPSQKRSSSGREEKKINYSIKPFEPLPGLPEDIKARIVARSEAMRAGTYKPEEETKEEAAKKIEVWLKSENGKAMQQILGPLSNPFIKKEKEEPKGTRNNKPMMQNLKGIINALKTNDVKPQENFNPNIEEEYSETEMWF